MKFDAFPGTGQKEGEEEEEEKGKTGREGDEEDEAKHGMRGRTYSTLGEPIEEEKATTKNDGIVRENGRARMEAENGCGQAAKCFQRQNGLLGWKMR
jgi:hypothetical protein